MENELDRVILAEMDKLYRYMYSRCRDEHKAEDLVQDTILTAYKSYPNLRDRDRVLPWLWGIAHNIYARSLKQRLQNREEPMDETTITTLAGMCLELPDEEVIKKGEYAKIRRAVSYLAKNYREVCVMYWLEEKSYEQISSELGIPLSSVKWRLSQAKNQLKKEYEKMDYMEKGYHKAVDLTVSVAGYEANGESLNDINDTMKSLLAKNICVSAYRKPKTVTEISSELGVAADYVEFELKKLLKIEAVKQVSDRYSTMFPILNKADNADMWGGNYDLALSEAGGLLDMVLERMEEIRKIGFTCSEKPAEKLILFVLGYLCTNIPENQFPSHMLPFGKDNKKWFILSTTEKCYEERSSGAGINASYYPSGCGEYWYISSRIDDDRGISSESLDAFIKLYKGEGEVENCQISKLIEDGKIEKDGAGYKSIVPVLDFRKGEGDKIDEILSPAFEAAAALQKRLLKRSNEAVRRHIPNQLLSQADFLGALCICQALENAFIEELWRRGYSLSSDMTSWYIIK